MCYNWACLHIYICGQVCWAEVRLFLHCWLPARAGSSLVLGVWIGQYLTAWKVHVLFMRDWLKMGLADPLIEDTFGNLKRWSLWWHSLRCVCIPVSFSPVEIWAAFFGKVSCYRCATQPCNCIVLALEDYRTHWDAAQNLMSLWGAFICRSYYVYMYVFLSYLGSSEFIWMVTNCKYGNNMKNLSVSLPSLSHASI